MTTTPAPTVELQNKLVDILTSIQNTVGEAKDFTMQQLPDVAQQYVMYGMAFQSFIMLAALAFFLSFAYGTYRMFTWKDGVDSWGQWSGQRLAGALSFGFAGLMSLVVLLANVRETFLVLFAPKVWLLMEIARLIK